MDNSFEKILETSGKLFQKQGYKGTSVREIAQQSGLAKATIYHYFADKEAIVQKLMERTVTSFHEVVERLASIVDPVDRLTATIEITLRFLNKSSSMIQLIRQELPERWSAVKFELTPIYDRYLSLISDSIDLGIETGDFRKINSHEAAIVLLNLIQGSYASTFIGTHGEELTRDNIAALLDIFFNGIVVSR